MFENSDLKQKAKAVLKKFGFKLPLLVSFVAGILASDFTKFSSAISENEEQLNTLYENPETAALLAIVMPIIGIIAILWGIFVAYPIVVGCNKFFMEYRLSGSKFETLFSGFKSGKYLNIVKTMFIMDLKIFLWTLLLIIPGIIKTYQYFMVPYILAENPNIETKRAFELSKEMTKGEKFNIFLLQLSFIGWAILCLFTCGIGYLFLEPYMNATFAELYQLMREKVLESGYAEPSELPGFGFLPEEQ